MIITDHFKFSNFQSSPSLNRKNHGPCLRSTITELVRSSELGKEENGSWTPGGTLYPDFHGKALEAALLATWQKGVAQGMHGWQGNPKELRSRCGKCPFITKNESAYCRKCRCGPSSHAVVVGILWTRVVNYRGKVQAKVPLWPSTRQARFTTTLLEKYPPSFLGYLGSETLELNSCDLVRILSP